MPFLNLDDNFADHPKVDALSDGAAADADAHRSPLTRSEVMAARGRTEWIDGRLLEEGAVQVCIPTRLPVYLACDRTRRQG